MYHLGASIKDLGKKCLAINRIENIEIIGKFIISNKHQHINFLIILIKCATPIEVARFGRVVLLLTAIGFGLDFNRLLSRQISLNHLAKHKNGLLQLRT